MNLRIILIALLTGCASTGAARNVAISCSEAGSLSRLIENPREVASLTLTGQIDAADLFYIGREFKNLNSLDLGQVTIVECKGVNIENRAYYPAATFPAGVFSGLPLQSIVFPTQDGLTIGDAAFMGTALKSIDLPENIDSIGLGAFSDCNNLEYAILPPCNLGPSIFAHCTGLKTATVSNIAIPDATFKGCTALSKVFGSAIVISIGHRAFENDFNLSEFYFGKFLKSIGDCAFAGSGLLNVDLSICDNLGDIGNQVFADCPIRKVYLPANLVSVGNEAFFGNSNLETFTLPTHLADIGGYAMSKMSGLTTINAATLETAPTLGENVWLGVDQTNVTLIVKDSAEIDFRSAEQWKEFVFDVTTSANNIDVDSIEQHGVTAHFNGNDVEVVSSRLKIKTLSLYNLSGALLARVFPDTFAATLSSADFDGNIFLIHAVLDDNLIAAFKLVRN